METRANHVWVGIVTLALLAGLAAFVVWLARLGQGDQNEYDILFKQSVEGLARGSQVSFSGVPVGQVNKIELWEKDPEFVRVRIKIDDKVPVLVGTTATVQASFTGVSTILLDGAVKGAPSITCETTSCPDGLPVIPPGRGGFGEIVANAPLLLERLATLTERLTQVLDDKNQTEISAILKNTNALTGNANELTQNANRVAESLASSAPQLGTTLVQLEGTLTEAQGAIAAFEQVMGSTDVLLNEEAPALSEELRSTMASASITADELSKTAAALTKVLNEVGPAASTVNQETLPALTATLEDVQATSKALRKVTERLENQGIGSLVEGQSLPDYEP